MRKVVKDFSAHLICQSNQVFAITAFCNIYYLNYNSTNFANLSNYDEITLFNCLQLGLFLKKLLITDEIPVSKSQLLKAISEYLNKRTSLVLSDISKFCICGGKGEGTRCKSSSSSGSAELLDLQQKQLEVCPSTTTS